MHTIELSLTSIAFAIESVLAQVRSYYVFTGKILNSNFLTGTFSLCGTKQLSLGCNVITELTAIGGNTQCTFLSAFVRFCMRTKTFTFFYHN